MLCLPVTPHFTLCRSSQAIWLFPNLTINFHTTQCHWWLLLSLNWSIPSPHSRALCLTCRALSTFTLCYYHEHAPLSLAGNGRLLKDCTQNIFASTMYLKQCLEHSRHSINVSRIVKIENSDSTTRAFVSNKGLFPKELGSTFAYSFFKRIFQTAYCYS